jgi:DNA-binding beta-propeller fold protein YncE
MDKEFREMMATLIVLRRALVIVSLVATGAMAGCSSNAPEATSSARPGPEASPGAELDSASPLPGQEIRPGVLLVDWGPRPDWDSGAPGAGRAALVPLDPRTAEELGRHEPFSAGQSFSAALSPDGRLLAASRAETQDGGTRKLEIFDLASWRALDLDQSLPKGVAIIGWHADGSRVYLMEEIRDHRWLQNRTVYAVSPSDGAWEIAAEVKDWTWSLPILSPDGATIYLPSYSSSQCCGIDVQGDPFIVATDLQTGGTLGSVDLPRLVVGQRLEARVRSNPDYSVGRWPGLAVAPDGNRLYIAHADEDRLTVVDLRRLVVERTVEISESRSALSRFGSWLLGQFVSTAEAKGGLRYAKQALVSQDSRYLYVTGQASTTCEEVPYFECGVEPVGLQVIDLGNMKLVRKVPGIDSLKVTPDGGYLLGIGTAIDYRSGHAESRGFGLKLIDAESFELVAHMQPDRIFAQLSVSPDGRYAYLLSEGDGWVENKANDTRSCEADCHRITVVDLDAAAVITERSINQATVSLIDLGR